MARGAGALELALTTAHLRSPRSNRDLPPSPCPDVAHGKGTPARALDIEGKAAEMRTVMARQ